MNTSEFNSCVEDHADGVYRFILKNIKNEHQAKDIVQDTFEKMWNRVETISPSTAKSYLFSAAYHTMIDKIRKDKRLVGMDEGMEESHFHQEQYSDLKKLLNEGLDRMPAQQKMVILLRDYEGYSYQEIGSITGLGEAQVKVYIYRARIFLREYIGKIENVI